MGAPLNNDNNKKNLYWSDALRKHIIQHPKDLTLAAQALFDKAKDGDVTAMKEIGDRLEGRPKQQVEMSGDLSLSFHEVLQAAKDRAAK